MRGLLVGLQLKERVGGERQTHSEKRSGHADVGWESASHRLDPELPLFWPEDRLAALRPPELLLPRPPVVPPLRAVELARDLDPGLFLLVSAMAGFPSWLPSLVAERTGSARVK